MYKDILFNKKNLDCECSHVNWLQDSGLCPQELEKGACELLRKNSGLSVAMQKARLFEYICHNGQIAVDINNIFQDKINHCDLIRKEITFKRKFGETGIWDGPLKEYHKLRSDSSKDGLWIAGEDFGHVCSDWRTLLSKGFAGILEEINRNLKKEDNTAKQKEFYESCRIYYEAAICYINRLAAAVESENYESSAVLRNIAKNPPGNMYEALQTIFIYFSLHEFVCGARNRSLGRLDKLLYGFYKNDIENGTFSEKQIRNMFRFFMYKLWVSSVPFDQPFMLGGADTDGSEITNELSHIIIEEYDYLNIHSPKIHIALSKRTPDDFIRKVLSCIRKGNSSFLLVNDEVAIKALVNVGISLEDAKNYILIGCYEPAAFGCEIPCTGNASVNTVKALELALAEDPRTPQELYEKTMQKIQKGIDDVISVICAVEKHYMDMYPDPFLSATYESCMKNGMDAYAGGAKYNNSSINVAGTATVIDSFALIHKFVETDKKISFEELKKAVSANWEGYEFLQREVLNSNYRYGNGCRFADELAKRFTIDIASMINNRPNARGGVFKAGLYSIDNNVKFGMKTGATPDGRKSGAPLAKNLCPTAGMEYGGVTTIIRSVENLDTWRFSNGSVLDLVFHPSAVSGDEGLAAILGLIKAYFKNGGFAVHGNVFDAEKLKEAQKSPDKYKNLQVRVCGWNAYFVNLTEIEQNEFIKQAELK